MMRVTIKGPAGCGKTTLANLIKSIYEAQHNKKVIILESGERYKRQPYQNHPDILIKTKRVCGNG